MRDKPWQINVKTWTYFTVISSINWCIITGSLNCKSVTVCRKKHCSLYKLLCIIYSLPAHHSTPRWPTASNTGNICNEDIFARSIEMKEWHGITQLSDRFCASQRVIKIGSKVFPLLDAVSQYNIFTTPRHACTLWSKLIHSSLYYTFVS